MKQFLSERLAAYGLLLILSLIVIFHLLVLTGVIPFNIVWGGRLKDHGQMVTFETISIGLNLLMIAIIMIYAGLLKVNVNRTVLRVLIWGMAALFLLNTAGNLLAVNMLEKLIFTPLTFLLALFSLRLAWHKEPAFLNA